MLRPLSPLLALSLAGCVLAPVDFEGRRCPCGPGWVCERGVCVIEGGEGDAGTIDGGPPTDAGQDAAFDGGPDVGPDAAVDAGPDASGPIGDAEIDAGGDPTHCDDLYADALFCDGFEWGAPPDLGAWDWTLLRTGTVTSVSTPAPFLGRGALRAEIAEGGGRAATGADLAGVIADGELWLRGYYYFPSALPVDGLSLLYMGSATGAEGLALQAFGDLQLATWIGSIGEWRGTTAALPRDRWTCLEMHVVLGDGTSGTLEAYVDGVMAVRHEMLDTLTVEGIAGVEAGIEYSNLEQVPGAVFVDEVVLSRTRAPCDP